jgi:hypothetical protein
VLQLKRQNGAEGRQLSAMNTTFDGTHGVAPASVQKLNVAIAKRCENNAKNRLTGSAISCSD